VSCSQHLEMYNLYICMRVNIPSRLYVVLVMKADDCGDQEIELKDHGKVHEGNSDIVNSNK